MYYHVLIAVNENGKEQELIDANKADIDSLIDDIIVPYYAGNRINFLGYFIKHDDVKRIVIKKSAKTIEEVIERFYRADSDQCKKSNVLRMQVFDAKFAFHNGSSMQDITKEIFLEARKLAGFHDHVDKVGVKDE